MTFKIISKNIIQKDNRTFLVKSRTDPNRWYVVFNSKIGLICDCQNFSIHQGRKQRCHHLKSIDKILGEYIILE